MKTASSGGLQQNTANQFPDATGRRLSVAIATSLAAHAVVFAVLPPVCRGCTPGPETARIEARLVGQSNAAVSGLPASSSTEPVQLGASHTPNSAGDLLSVGSLLPKQRSKSVEFGEGAAETMSETGIPVVDRHKYLPSKDLEIRPHPVSAIEPAIPDNADPQPVSVVLRLWISPEGKVDRVVTVSGPTGERFSRSAATAFAMSRFSPGVKNGVPVGAEILVEVEFDQDVRPESKASSHQ